MEHNLIEKPASKVRVSVVVPSYNHEKYITDALVSVTAQTFRDFEIICCDDASGDRSCEKISEFISSQSEIPCRFLRHEKNLGGVITLNHLIEMADGEYVALINSDDLWLHDKLAMQVNFLDEHPDVAAVFTQAVIIDDHGQVQTQTVDFPHDIFIQENRSRGEWLRRLFFELNCLCHPSILIRRAVYREIGLYDPRFRQLPDMQMWVRLIKRFEIHIIEQPLVQLRFHKSNTSVVNVDTSRRNLNELSYILEEFFDQIPDMVFAEGFKSLFKNQEAESPEELDCEKAFLYFRLQNSIKSLYFPVGLRRLYRLMGSGKTNEVLSKIYNFQYNDFFTWGGTHFYDEHLIAFTKAVETSADGSTLFSTWRFLFALNKRYLGAYLRRYPKIYLPLIKVWGRLRGKAK